MTIRWKSCLFAMVFVLKAPQVFAWGCPAVIDPMWQAPMTSSKGAVSAAVTHGNTTIAEQRMMNSERVTSALKVLTEQIKAMGDAQAQASIQSGRALAQHMVDVSQYKQKTQRGIDYSVGDGVTAINGQGTDPCGETQRSAAVSIAVAAANEAISDKVMRELDASPGFVSKSVAKIVGRRVADARKTYCTQEEAASGYCSSAGPMAGKDVDAANFYSSSAVNSDSNTAKNALLNNMYGVPAQAPDEAVVKKGVGQNFFAAKRRSDAIQSVSQNSMKTIQSWTESRGDNLSVQDAISQKVGTYAGGDNFEAWASAKALQSEHGLLVDYAKMKAFELTIRNLEYQQMERMEANLAALLAMRASRMSASGANAQAGAATERVR